MAALPLSEREDDREQQRNSPRVLLGPQDSITDQLLLAYRCTAVRAAALLHCWFGLVVEWWVGGFCAGWSHSIYEANTYGCCCTHCGSTVGMVVGLDGGLMAWLPGG